MALFVEHILNLPSDITECIKGKVDEWILSQTSFQALLKNNCWES